VADAVALNAPPDMVTVTWSEAGHDPDVAVRVKIVVVVRFTVVGSTTVAFTSDDAGSQLYESPVPVTVALRVVLVPYGMV
jgi:hypothetical protein